MGRGFVALLLLLVLDSSMQNVAAASVYSSSASAAEPSSNSPALKSLVSEFMSAMADKSDAHKSADLKSELLESQTLVDLGLHPYSLKITVVVTILAIADLTQLVTALIRYSAHLRVMFSAPRKYATVLKFIFMHAAAFLFSFILLTTIAASGDKVFLPEGQSVRAALTSFAVLRLALFFIYPALFIEAGDSIGLSVVVYGLLFISQFMGPIVIEFFELLEERKGQHKESFPVMADLRKHAKEAKASGILDAATQLSSTTAQKPVAPQQPTSNPPSDPKAKKVTKTLTIRDAAKSVRHSLDMPKGAPVSLFLWIYFISNVFAMACAVMVLQDSITLQKMAAQ